MKHLYWAASTLVAATAMTACGGQKSEEKKARSMPAEEAAADQAFSDQGFALSKADDKKPLVGEGAMSFAITVLDGDMMPILGAKVGVIQATMPTPPKAPAAGETTKPATKPAAAKEIWVENDNANTFTLAIKRNKQGQSFRIDVNTQDGSHIEKYLVVPAVNGPVSVSFPVIVNPGEGTNAANGAEITSGTEETPPCSDAGPCH